MGGRGVLEEGSWLTRNSFGMPPSDPLTRLLKPRTDTTMPELNTDCSKCGAKMTLMPAMRSTTTIEIMASRMTITGYLCKACDHWNNLKRRKGWKKPA